MCGRFLLTLDFNDLYHLLEERFNNLQRFDIDYSSRFNIAPSQPILSVINDGQQHRVGYLKWGFIPHWAKDEKIGYKMINARAETIDQKTSYKNSFINKRCLILSNGFYEWEKTESGKVPRLIQLKNQQLFTMAGLYNTFRNAKGEKVNSCTIITTTPNESIRKIHDRMPVILSPKNEKAWLNPSLQDPVKLKALLKTYPAEEMEIKSPDPSWLT